MGGAFFLPPWGSFCGNAMVARSAGPAPTVLHADKRKKKKPKKKSSGRSRENPSENAEESAGPKRITNDALSIGGMSLRGQLKCIREHKARVSAPAVPPRPKARFHKKAVTLDASEAALQRARDATNSLADVSKGAGGIPLVVVDGYNIIMATPRYRSKMKSGGGAARLKLVADLQDLAGLKGWRVVVVFDGSGYEGERDGSGMSQDCSENPDNIDRADVGKVGVSVVYSPMATEADEVIEKIASRNKSEGLTGKFVVVSDDGTIRNVAGGHGAMVIGCRGVIDEMKASRKAALSLAEVAVERVTGESKYSKKGWLVEDNIDLSRIREELERRRSSREAENGGGG